MSASKDKARSLVGRTLPACADLGLCGCPKALTLISACLLLIGCHAVKPPMLMSPSTRAEADALMRPKVSLLPPLSKALTSRVVIGPPPVAITNVTVAWNDAPVPLYPVMIPSSNNLTAPLTLGTADFLSVIQGPTNSVRLVGLLVASTNGWRSQYQVTPDMPYAPSNGVVRRMIQNEQFRAGYKFTR